MRLRRLALFIGKQCGAARLPHSTFPCSGLVGTRGQVDLGGLTDTHSVPSKVFYGCFMEIILWSM
jgi:hypothetical protein